MTSIWSRACSSRPIQRHRRPARTRYPETSSPMTARYSDIQVSRHPGQLLLSAVLDWPVHEYLKPPHQPQPFTGCMYRNWWIKVFLTLQVLGLLLYTQECAPSHNRIAKHAEVRNSHANRPAWKSLHSPLECPLTKVSDNLFNILHPRIERTMHIGLVGKIQAL